MKTFLSFLVLGCLAVAPKAKAQPGIPIEGAFAVSAFAKVNSSAETFTTLGALSFNLNKTADPAGAIHGIVASSDSLLFLGGKIDRRPIMAAGLRVATFYELPGILLRCEIDASFE